YADDVAELRFVKEVEPLTEGIFARPEVPGHRFVDHRDRLRVFAIGVREDAAADDGNTQSFEVGGRNGIECGERAAIAGGFVLTFGENRAAKATANWEVRGYGGELHARSGGSSLDGCAEKLLGFTLIVVKRAKIKSHHEELV